MINCNTPAIVLTAILLLSMGCNDQHLQPSLDHYGSYENTELVLTIEADLDTCDIRLSTFQELYGWLNVDTTAVVENGKVEMILKLTLERPSIVQVDINNLQKEIFLMPDQSSSLAVSMDTTSIMKISFENKDLENINVYYRKRAEIGGDMMMRSAYHEAVAHPEFLQTLDSIDALRSRLVRVLNTIDQSLDLPTWFVDYEEKRLDHLAISLKATAPRVRRLVFGLQDTIPENFKIKDLGFDSNDELALTNPNFLNALSTFTAGDLSDSEIEQDLASRLSQNLENGLEIENKRIRDVYLSKLLYIMVRTSQHIPDSLILSVKNGISEEMQDYVTRIEKKYTKLNGKQAPAMHLRDRDDNLVSLHDFRGNLLLLDFWFVGCPHCKDEIPSVKLLLDDFEDQNFEVLQICMKSDRDTWVDLKDDFVGIPLYSNENWDRKLEKSYQITGYPRYVLVDENGVILEGWCERPSDPALKLRILNHFGLTDSEI